MAAGDRDRWNDKWAEAGRGTSHGSALIDLVSAYLPPTGRLLDVAGGGSMNSLAFARLGLDVTVADISDVGLIQARQRALAEDRTIATLEIDLETTPLPDQLWDVITVSNYLQRDLLSRLPEQLEIGGILAVVIATQTNRDRHDRPGPDHLLHPEELVEVIYRHDPERRRLELVDYHEAWRTNGRHEAHLVGRRITP